MVEEVKTEEKKDFKPYKLSRDVVRKFEEAFAIDATVEEACFYAGISRDTYYRWIKFWPKLAEKYDRLRQKPMLKARQTIVNSLDNPDYAFKYAERKKKNEFSLRTEISGPDGEKIEGIQVQIVTNENKQNETKPESNSSIPEELPKQGENNSE